MRYKEEEIKIIAEGGKILARIMRELKNRIEPGLSTKELDKLADELILKSDARPAFKGYHGFPNSLCVSLNEEVVHGVPSERRIEQGDIISLDLGIFYKGFCTDMAFTVPVGEVEPEALRLIRITKKALKRAITRCKPGKTLGDVGQAIQTYIENQDFQVIRELCGHGVGKQIQESPEVLNFGQRHKGVILEQGMVLALEPTAAMGQPGIKRSNNGQTYLTVDKSLSAHFEHTVAVTDKGPRVLTE